MTINKKELREFAELIGGISNDIKIFNGYVDGVPVDEVTQVLAEIGDKLVDFLADATIES